MAVLVPQPPRQHFAARRAPARGIPYSIRSGLRFFEQAHIKDVLAHLRVVVNPRDESSWRRLLLLLPGIGPAKAAAIFQLLSQSGRPFEALESRRGDGTGSGQEQRFLRGFVADLKKVRATNPEPNPAAAVAAILKGGYPATVKLLYERPENRIADIEQFASWPPSTQSRAADWRIAPGRRRLRDGLGRQRRSGRNPGPEHGPPGQGARMVARLRSSAWSRTAFLIAAPSKNPAVKTKNGAFSTWQSPGR